MSKKSVGSVKTLAPTRGLNATAKLSRGWGLTHKRHKISTNYLKAQSAKKAFEPRARAVLAHKNAISFHAMQQNLRNDNLDNIVDNRLKFTRPKEASVCSRRSNRRKVIMSITKGKGLSVKNAKWTDLSKISCKG